MPVGVFDINAEIVVGAGPYAYLVDMAVNEGDITGIVVRG